MLIFFGRNDNKDMGAGLQARSTNGRCLWDLSNLRTSVEHCYIVSTTPTSYEVDSS
ncbi:hypothetical protein CCHR01_06041 [Colletotrichum chrysophilum]|uniref:Uncharacterized protein n=1 Tax=Colletotrichum chrysophilum TaxID=1836956 RepID=A0AAD9ENS6_9PEZI|nr:hypothetical protein CCHR01_06041 [Colletotrichum chrysophilum]